ARHDRPAVVEDVDLVPTDVDHRLDREAHARGEPSSVAAPSDVRHLRRLGEGPAHFGPPERAPDRAHPPPRELVNCRPDVAETRAVAHDADAEVERAPRRFRDVTRLFRGLSDVEGGRRVAVEALVDGGYVDVDDVAVLQLLSARNAVANDFVD